MSTASNPGSTTSPNVNNYYIGRGSVFWTPVNGSERDMGNAPSFQFKPAIKNLDHFSSRKGIKLKDLSIVIEANATVIVELEEWTPDNIALALMGDGTEIFNQAAIFGSLRFVGANDIGPTVTLVLPHVSFAPSGTLDVIASKDAFGVIQLTGDVLADPTTGSFGTMSWTA
jgi:hypothetical protein